MARVKQFETKLQSLFRRRTAWLRSSVGRKKLGRAPIFSKDIVEKKLKELESVARSILIDRRGKSAFKNSYNNKHSWHPKRGKGHGIPAKKENFDRWYEKDVKSRNCVYVFWSKRRCLYVGRTQRGKGRARAHFEKYWFSRTTRIDIYTVVNSSGVSRLECLAIDLFNPRINKNKASKKKYDKKCPICSATKDIHQELKSVFKSKRGRVRTRRLKKRRHRI